MGTLYWTGEAITVPEVATLTFASTWATNDTATITFTNPYTNVTLTFTVTLGTPVTTADVASLFATCFNSDVAINDTTGSCNVGGQSIPQFSEVEATASGAVVTFTTKPGFHGRPFFKSGAASGIYTGPGTSQQYWAATESTAGTGTATLASVTLATGPNWFSNGDNWTGGAAPATGDALVFENGSVDCSFGFPLGTVSIQIPRIDFYNTYTGSFGLPVVDRTNTEKSYYQFRPRFPIFGNGGATTPTLTYNIGIGDGDGAKYIAMYLDEANVPAFNIDCAGTNPPAGERVVNVSSYSVATLNIRRGLIKSGRIGLIGGGFVYGRVAAVNMTCPIGNTSDANLDIEFDSSSGVAIKQVGGTIYIHDTTWTTGTLSAVGGLTIIKDAIPATSALVADGTLQWIGAAATLPTLDLLSGGHLDMSSATGVLTLTNANYHAGCKVTNPAKKITHTNPVQIYGQLSAMAGQLDYGYNRTLQIAG